MLIFAPEDAADNGAHQLRPISENKESNEFLGGNGEMPKSRAALEFF